MEKFYITVKRLDKSHWIWLVLTLIAVSNAYIFFDTYDFQHGIDGEDYLSMASGNYDVSPIRRYRWVIPLLSGSLFSVLSPFVHHDLLLRGCFFVTNAVIFSVAIYLLIRYLIRLNISLEGIFVGCLVAVTSRWSGYFIGHPYIDSLYVLAIVFMLWTLDRKNPYLFAFGVFLGCVAKESFVFFIPVYFYFSKVSWQAKTFGTLLAGLLYVGSRWYLDQTFHLNGVESVEKDVAHVEIILPSLRLLFSPFGIATIFFVFLPFHFYILFTVNRWKDVFYKIPTVLWWFWPVIAIHMLLSGTIDRMYFFVVPFWVVWVGMTWDLVQPFNKKQEI